MRQKKKLYKQKQIGEKAKLPNERLIIIESGMIIAISSLDKRYIFLTIYRMVKRDYELSKIIVVLTLH